jgi:hypothetical protein
MAIEIKLPILTLAELDAARQACMKCTKADKAADKAKKAKEGALAQIFFKMGFANLAEVKALDAVALANCIQRRTGKAFEVETKAVGIFAVVKTSAGKYPQWKQELVRLSGPAEAAEIESNAPAQYSYSVIQAADAKGTSGVFVLSPAIATGAGKKATAK